MCEGTMAARRGFSYVKTLLIFIENECKERAGSNRVLILKFIRIQLFRVLLIQLVACSLNCFFGQTFAAKLIENPGACKQGRGLLIFASRAEMKITVFILTLIVR